MGKRRFASPTELTKDTKVLGVPVRDWDKYLTGNVEKSLAEVKRRVEEVEAGKDAADASAPKRRTADASR